MLAIVACGGEFEQERGAGARALGGVRQGRVGDETEIGGRLAELLDAFGLVFEIARTVGGFGAAGTAAIGDQVEQGRIGEGGRASFAVFLRVVLQYTLVSREDPAGALNGLLDACGQFPGSFAAHLAPVAELIKNLVQAALGSGRGDRPVRVSRQACLAADDDHAELVVVVTGGGGDLERRKAGGGQGDQ